MALIGTLLSWAVFGLVIGLVARMLYPGRQPMSLVMTMILGIVGSFVGRIHLLHIRLRSPGRRVASVRRDHVDRGSDSRGVGESLRGCQLDTRQFHAAAVTRHHFPRFTEREEKTNVGRALLPVALNGQECPPYREGSSGLTLTTIRHFVRTSYNFTALIENRVCQQGKPRVTIQHIPKRPRGGTHVPR